MLNLGTSELLVVLLVALLVLGPSKLPEAARQAGKLMAELRKISTGFQAEMRDALREPPPTLPPLPVEAQTPAPAVPTPAEPGVAAPAPEPTPARRRRAPLRANGAAAEQSSE